VCQRTRLVGLMGSQRSAVVSTACGPACEGKTPLGLGVPEVLDVKPQKGGGSAAACWQQGSTAMTRTTPLQGPTRPKTRLGKKKNELLSGVGTRRRDGTTRRLGVGWLTAQQRRLRGCGRMGASRCSARTRVKLARIKCSKGRGFTPCCHTRFFPKKTECISYVCQDHNFTHMIYS
jgi:hypothetical protein